MMISEFIRSFSRSSHFVLELLLADIIFLKPFDRKDYFLLRLVAGIIIMILSSGIIFFLTQSSPFNHIFSFAFSLGFTLFLIRSCFDVSWSDAAFCATAGYNVQFIGSIISEFIQRTFGLARWPLEIAVMAVVYTLIYHIFGKQVQDKQNLDISRIFLYFLLVAAVLTDIVICGMLRPYWMAADNRTEMICAMLLLFMSAFGILALQFTLLKGKSLADELNVVEQLMRKESAQYQFSKDTIDSINRKCHDMRHQIRTIGSQQHMSPDAIHEITDAINIYDTLYRTGSQALDTILTEKKLYCQDYGISINCMVDGKKLSFMRDTDIYSLFGNMLENAILAVTEVPGDDRDIYLSVVSKGELISIHAYNPYAGIIKMKDGMPLTKNADVENHGIGTRSMQLIAEKYHGTVSFDTRDGVFHVYILIPLPQN